MKEDLKKSSSLDESKESKRNMAIWESADTPWTAEAYKQKNQDEKNRKNQLIRQRVALFLGIAAVGIAAWRISVLATDSARAQVVADHFSELGKFLSEHQTIVGVTFFLLFFSSFTLYCKKNDTPNVRLKNNTADEAKKINDSWGEERWREFVRRLVKIGAQDAAELLFKTFPKELSAEVNRKILSNIRKRSAMAYGDVMHHAMMHFPLNPPLEWAIKDDPGRAAKLLLQMLDESHGEKAAEISQKIPNVFSNEKYGDERFYALFLMPGLPTSLGDQQKMQALAYLLRRGYLQAAARVYHSLTEDQRNRFADTYRNVTLELYRWIRMQNNTEIAQLCLPQDQTREALLRGIDYLTRFAPQEIAKAFAGFVRNDPQNSHLFLLAGVLDELCKQGRSATTAQLLLKIYEVDKHAAVEIYYCLNWLAASRVSEIPADFQKAIKIIDCAQEKNINDGFEEMLKNDMIFGSSIINLWAKRDPELCAKVLSDMTKSKLLRLEWFDKIIEVLDREGSSVVKILKDHYLQSYTLVFIHSLGKSIETEGSYKLGEAHPFYGLQVDFVADAWAVLVRNNEYGKVREIVLAAGLNEMDEMDERMKSFKEKYLLEYYSYAFYSEVVSRKLTDSLDNLMKVESKKADAPQRQLFSLVDYLCDNFHFDQAATVVHRFANHPANTGINPSCIDLMRQLQKKRGFDDLLSAMKQLDSELTKKIIALSNNKIVEESKDCNLKNDDTEGESLALRIFS